MHRFYATNADFHSSEFTLSDTEEIHHLKNVLRLKLGATIYILNGRGEEASGEIISLNNKSVIIRISLVKETPAPKPIIILACAIPKKSKFETIIEKTTELGVDEIIPLLTQRTEIKLTEERGEKKQSRYQTIAINAAKQSRRLTVPIIHPATKFNQVLKTFTQDSIAIIPSLMEPRTPLLTAFEKIHNPAKLTFFIGPEGDFTEEEYHLITQLGGIPVSLGKTILKVETAAIATIACAQLIFRR